MGKTVQAARGRGVALAFLLALTVATPALGEPSEPAFREAVAQHQKGRWADAFGRFVALANAGDADAARIALFMVRHGPVLYGSYWDAMPADMAYWNNLAASGQGRAQPVFRPDPEPNRLSATPVRTTPASKAQKWARARVSIAP